MRGILEAGPGLPKPVRAAEQLVLDLPIVPVRSLSAYALVQARLAVMAAAAPPLPPDLIEGVRRLKLATTRSAPPLVQQTPAASQEHDPANQHERTLLPEGAGDTGPAPTVRGLSSGHPR